MKYLQSRWIIGIFCFVLGAAAMFVARGLSARKAYSHRVATRQAIEDLDGDDIFEASFANFKDPFEEARKLREAMMKDFDEDQSDDGFFGMWKKGGSRFLSVGEIKRREDDKYVYYEISTKNIDPKKLHVKVGREQIDISGQSETKSGDDHENRLVSSSFQRSFPVPPNVDARKVQMESKSDKLVIKLPKV